MDLNFGKPLPDGLNIVGHGWYGHGTHAGLDIAVPVGTPIFAIGDGFVTHVGSQAQMGNYVVIAHSSGVVSRYLHLSQHAVSAGQVILKGDQIGLSGNTGQSAGPHLHIDLKAPAEVVEQVRAEVGEPSTGFETNITGFGIGFPAEPWIPTDGYAPSVEAGAAQYGIPLYRPRGIRSLISQSHKPLLISALVVAVAYFAFRRR